MPFLVGFSPQRLDSEVQNVSFPDEDLDLSDLGGLLEWLPPLDMSQVTHYMVYFAKPLEDPAACVSTYLVNVTNDTELVAVISGSINFQLDGATASQVEQAVRSTLSSSLNVAPDAINVVIVSGARRLQERQLVAADHHALDPRVSVQAAGLEDGDYLTAIVLEARLAATRAAFALFCSGGDRVVTWGTSDNGGDSSEVQDQLKGVQQVQATDRAFAAILADGSVVTWGSRPYGGDSSEVQDQLKGVQQVQATEQAFAAILADGSVVTWGSRYDGGDSSEVQDQLKGVQQIQATWFAFAAILADGSVVTWGSQYDGGDSSEVQDQLKGVQQVQATERAFAAILADGSVVTWGNPYVYGGDSSEVQDQLKGVQQVQATERAFAAILADGSVVTWGASDKGGDSSEVQDQLKGLQQVQATEGAFAAILADGSVVTWGSPDFGGDSSEVQDQLKGVQQIQATSFRFAAILADGSVVTWANPRFGGDSSKVQDQLKGVQQVQATKEAFAAILADGSVVTWGRSDSGGASFQVQDQLKGVQQIQASEQAFAAILADGSVVTWGSPDYGGDSAAVTAQLAQSWTVSYSLVVPVNAASSVISAANGHSASPSGFASLLAPELIAAGVASSSVAALQVLQFAEVSVQVISADLALGLVSTATTTMANNSNISDDSDADEDDMPVARRLSSLVSMVAAYDVPGSLSISKGWCRQFIISNLPGEDNVTVVPDTAIGNFTHFLVYTASSLVEQTTPVALEIFDEFASVSNISFVDLDLDLQQLGGNISWVEPSLTRRVEEYLIYLAEDTMGLQRSLVDRTPQGSTAVAMPPETSLQNFTFLLIATRSALVEQSTPSSLGLVDEAPVVFNISLDDLDLDETDLGGEVSWQTSDERLVQNYVFYFASPGTTSCSDVSEVATVAVVLGTLSFALEGVESWQVDSATRAALAAALNVAPEQLAVRLRDTSRRLYESRLLPVWHLEFQVLLPPWTELDGDVVKKLQSKELVNALHWSFLRYASSYCSFAKRLQ
eukprot:s1750_g17.t1